MDQQLEQLERFNIVSGDLKPKTKTALLNAVNDVSNHLDWLAQQLGLSGGPYWDDLNLSLFEKRRILANALACDPELRFPLSKDIGDYRIITVTLDGDDIVMLDRINPTLYLYGGNTYLFNIEQYKSFTIDQSDLVEVIDRRHEGYLIVMPSKELISQQVAINYGDSDQGTIYLLPWRNCSDWVSNISPIRKNSALDAYFDGGYEWNSATTYDGMPLYPDYGRLDSPPTGFVFVDQRPPLQSEDADFFSAQYFRYDNSYFQSLGFPELVQKPPLYYDFWGLHGSKGSPYSFNLMVDILGFKGFNDKTLVLESTQPSYSNYRGSFQENTLYYKNQTLTYNSSDLSLQSWYCVARNFTSSSNLSEDIQNGNVYPLPPLQRATYRMQKDTRNDIIPLRIWAQKDLQVANVDNLANYDNKLIAGVGYTTGKDSNIYHVRLPLEYERNGSSWRKIELIAKTYCYFGDDNPKVEYAYFAAGFSAAGDTVYSVNSKSVLFEPTDPRHSLYIKNNP